MDADEDEEEEDGDEKGARLNDANEGMAANGSTGTDGRLASDRGLASVFPSPLDSPPDSESAAAAIAAAASASSAAASSFMAAS